MTQNPIINNLYKKIEAQQAKGLKKYGRKLRPILTV